MATVRAFLGQCVDLLLGPVQPLAEQSEELADLQKDLASSVAWSFQALLAASAFCAVTAAGHDDWDLLTQASTAAAAGSETELPLVSVKLAFLPFLLIAPIALLAMQIYLQIQSHALLLLPRATENSLIRNHDRWWPISLLGFASYIVVPMVTLFLLWKIWPRRFSDDPVIFHDIRFHIGRAAVGAALLISCMASLRGALADRRCLVRLNGHIARRRMSRKPAFGLVLVFLGISVSIGIAFSDRHLELRKAPLDGADLRYFDLSDADLREARLKGALMGGAMLPNATLAGASMDNADLRGAQLTGADLSQSRLNNADLTGAWLVGANLRRVEAEGAHFDWAWLVGAVFEPLPATPADRTKPAKPEELAYAQAGTIQKMALGGAQMCAAVITPGHWKDRAVQVGEIDVTGGQPFYDEKDTRPIPAQLHAAPLSRAIDGAPGGRERFLADALEHCFLKLRICALNPFPSQCDWTSGE
jgi:hypothetical protein